MGFIIENNRSPLACALGLGIVFSDKSLATTLLSTHHDPNSPRRKEGGGEQMYL